MSEPQDLGRMIGYCGHLCRLYTDKYLREAGYDVTPVQSHTLGYLFCCGREVNQRELEQALRISGNELRREVNQRDLERELRLKPSTVNGIVSRLEEKELISRRASPDDGRFRLVGLTEAGRNKVLEFRAALGETDRWFAAALSPEERKQLCRLLSRVITNLENEVNAT